MSINEQLKNIWVEKYRPAKLADMVLSDSLRSFVQECQTKGEIPNMLLVGNAGTGKTTLAKVIVNEILDAQYLYINASEKNGIDEVRTSILSFAQTKSIDGKIKVIFLDEFDNFTDAGQRALRNVMEEYAGNTRFILTGNYLHRIIQPIQSRCQVFTDFTPPIKEYAKRIVYILQNENITFDGEQVDRLKEVIRYNYPDLRRIINFVQRNIIDNPYRGDMGVKLYNFSDVNVYIFKGDKVAQLIVYPLIQADVEWTDQVVESARGEKGFGSSDKK